MKFSQYREIVACDRARYNKKWTHFQMLVMNPCYRITVSLRKCEFLGTHKSVRLLWLIQRYLHHRKCVKYGCDIPSRVHIGPGLRIDHPQGIVINSKALIGENLTIKSGAVIGGNENGVPVIGDNVLIGVHALVIGDVRVGDNAKIGAGAIVVRDVPNDTTAVCTPAHNR